jgi:hypothetical protein
VRGSHDRFIRSVEATASVYFNRRILSLGVWPGRVRVAYQLRTRTCAAASVRDLYSGLKAKDGTPKLSKWF